MTRTLACGCLAMSLALLGCGGDDGDERDGLTEPPPAVKPAFDWGYPEYSEYMDGKHVGTTLYQQDATCKNRLTFYACAFINAETPNNAMNNPTMASQAMMGGLDSGLDSCTVEIENTEPSYCIPADVCSPTMPPWAPGQASTDNLAWQLFIALNWPADAEQPGYPDTSQKLGATNPGGVGHAEAVWLDYPTPAALFGVPSPCEGPTLTMSTKVSRNFLSKPHHLGATGGLGDTVEAFGGTLVDQNGKVVFFDIRVNRTEWEFIVNRNDYWKTGVSLDAIKPNLTRDYSVPPGMTPGSFPAAIAGGGEVVAVGDIGATEIKAAWRQLTDEEAAAGTYYTRVFNLYDPDAPPGQAVHAAHDGARGSAYRLHAGVVREPGVGVGDVRAPAQRAHRGDQRWRDAVLVQRPELHADQDTRRVRRVRPHEGLAGRVQVLPQRRALPRGNQPVVGRSSAEPGDAADRSDRVDDPPNPVQSPLSERDRKILRQRQRLQELLPGERTVAAARRVDELSVLQALVRSELPLHPAQFDDGDLRRRPHAAPDDRL